MKSFKNYIYILFFVFSAGLALAQDRQQAPLRLTLKEAMQSAVGQNFQVMMANARVEQAIAQISVSQSAMLPQIDGIISGSRQSGDLRAGGINIPIPGYGPHIKPYNTFNARPRLTIALFDPSAFERFQAAKKGQNLSQAQREKTREDVLALVASLYEDAQRKEQTAQLMKKLLDRDLMAFDLSRDNLNQGTGTEIDSNKLKSALQQTRYIYNQAKLEAFDAALDLKAALQLPLDRPLVFMDDRDFQKALEANTKKDFDHATNADMVLAKSQLESRQADQKTAYADFLPKITGTADYGRSGESPSHGSNTYFVGLQASIPIWEGGNQQAKLKQVNAQIKEAEENYHDITRQEEVNIAKARAAIIEANDLNRSKAQALQTAQRSLQIAFHAQQIGSGTVLQLVQAKADLAIAEDDYNEARSNWVMSHIDLLHAQGRLRELVK